MAYSFVYVVSLFSFTNWLSFLLKNLRFQGIWKLEDFTVCIMDFLYSLVQCPVFLLSFEMVYTPEILGCDTKKRRKPTYHPPCPQPRGSPISLVCDLFTYFVFSALIIVTVCFFLIYLLICT